MSSKFVSSSIPSWQILTAHVQPFRGARDLAFCLKVPLDSLLVWASSKGSGETARMRRLAWTFAARIWDKYQIRLRRSILSFSSHLLGNVCNTTVSAKRDCLIQQFIVNKNYNILITNNVPPLFAAVDVLYAVTGNYFTSHLIDWLFRNNNHGSNWHSAFGLRIDSRQNLGTP